MQIMQPAKDPSQPVDESQAASQNASTKRLAELAVSSDGRLVRSSVRGSVRPLVGWLAEIGAVGGGGTHYHAWL